MGNLAAQIPPKTYNATDMLFSDCFWDLAGLAKPMGPWAALGMFVVLVFIGIPILVMLFALLLAPLVMIVDKTDFGNAFWWACSVQTGGGMPLSDADASSIFGKWIGVICAGWSIGISTLTIGLQGAP